MEFVRQISDSSLLDKLHLPQSLKNQKIAIRVLPFNEAQVKINENTETEKIMESIINSNEFKKNLTEMEEKIYNIEDLVGIASKYAKHDLPIDEIIKKEKEAWANSVVDKYGYNS